LGLTYGSGLSILILMAAMFAPAISNILTRLMTKEGFQNMYLRPHFKGHKRAYLLIYFVPTILLLLSAVVYFLLNPGSFDPQLTVLKELSASKGIGFSAQQLLLISILQVLLIGPVINLIPTMGEELGWRGYLLPKLRECYSDRVALVLTGVIWGLWHTPVIVMGHNYGVNYFGYPWLGILAMIVFCVVLGVVEGFVSIRLESAIPAAMIHSAVNAGAGLPLSMVKAGYNPLMGPAITGVIGGLPFMILAILLLYKIGKKRNVNEVRPHD
jgi:membrane protease YdiL (CAAX protease family)